MKIDLIRKLYELENSDFITDEEIERYLKEGIAVACAKIEDKLGLKSNDAHGE